MARKDNKKRNLHTGESQRKDGSYMFRYIDPLTGKRKAIYANDLPELRAKEKQVQRDLEEHILTDAECKKMTLNDLFDRYLKTKEIEDTTISNYMYLWDKFVRNTIGNFKIIALRPSQVRIFYANLSKKGLAYNTIKYIHMIIFPTLELAVNDDIIRKNPSKGILSKEYGKAKRDKYALEEDEQEKLFAFMKQNPVYQVYIPMFTILLEVGLRCGELIGLTWKDLNLEEKTLSVNHQLIYKNLGEGYKFYAKSPKTETSEREIPLTTEVCEAFKEQQALNSLLRRFSLVSIDTYTDFIFLTKNGTPLMPSAVNNIIYNVINAYNEAEKESAEKENREPHFIPKISAHNMRHTACTNMSRRGLNPKTVQYILGHAHIEETMETYNHLNNLESARQDIESFEKKNEENGVKMV